MPRVPVYGQQTVDVRPVPSARLDVSPGAAFGAMVQTGNTVERAAVGVYETEQVKADEIAVMSANRKLKERTNQLLFDPREGALTKTGRDAFGLPETTVPAYDKAAGEIEAELGTDRQKLAFRRIATQQRGELDLTVQRHVYQERYKYDNDETENAVRTARDTATNYYNDPRRVGVEIDDIKQSLILFAQRNGKGPEWLAQATQDQVSKVHLSVIQAALANQQDQYAKTYYDETKGSIVGEDRTKAAALVEAGTMRGESQRKADEIIKKGIQRAEAFDEIRKIEDPKLRDLVEQRVDHFFNQRDAAQHEIERLVFDKLSLLIDGGMSYAQLNPQFLQQITPEQRSALRHYAKTVSKGEKPDTDWSLYYDLMRQATTDPAAFAKVDLMKYRHKLDDTEFKEVTHWQAAYNKKDDKFEDTMTGYRTTTQIVDGSLTAAGLDPTPNNKAMAERVARFRRTVDEQIILYEQNNRKKPNSVEVQGIVDNLLVEGKVRGPDGKPTGWFGFSETRKAFELQPGQTIVMKVTDIPFNERKKITDALQRKGEPVTNDAVINLYNLKLQRMLPKQ